MGKAHRDVYGNSQTEAWLLHDTKTQLRNAAGTRGSPAGAARTGMSLVNPAGLTAGPAAEPRPRVLLECTPLSRERSQSATCVDPKKIKQEEGLLAPVLGFF